MRGRSVYYIIIAGIVLLDQIVKAATDCMLVPGESVPVIENVFHLTYVQNTGAAFSILQSHRGLLVLLSAILVVLLLVFFIRRGKGQPALLNAAMAAIISGGIGNMIDRIVRGYVVDTFDFRVWPVFNVADISVCVGCALLLIYVIFFDRKNPESGEKRDDAKSV